MIYSFINFEISLSATKTFLKVKELPKTFGVANTERLLDDFGKKIAETLLRYMMFLGFYIGNYITNLLQQLYS